jgi:hypothetical protein
VTVLHAYAVLGEGLVPEGLRGIDGAAVELVPLGRLRVAATEHASTPAPERGSMLAHAAVVSRLYRCVPTVPVRFGQAVVEGPGGAPGVDTEHFEVLLREVGGRVEYAVRATRPPPPVASDRSASDGRAYLESRREAERTRTAYRVDLHRRLIDATDPLVPLAVSTRAVEGRAGPERCFLVDGADDDVFRRRAEEVLGTCVDLLLTGPWPPYTFVTTASEIAR